MYLYLQKGGTLVTHKKEGAVMRNENIRYGTKNDICGETTVTAAYFRDCDLHCKI